MKIDLSKDILIQTWRAGCKISMSITHIPTNTVVRGGPSRVWHRLRDRLLQRLQEAVDKKKAAE
jgi:hypothetical protein